MTFEFHRFRFHFRAARTVFFPPYKSGNIVRGAFGTIFRRLVCAPECRGAATCERRATCPYARIFEPKALAGGGPSGLADWPRPFVFRASHLDGRSIGAAERFHFDVHIFDVRDPSVAYFAAAFAQLASEGLGPGRAPAELTAVDQLDLTGNAVMRVYEYARFRDGELSPPNRLELSAGEERVNRVAVRFVTPTELKGAGQATDAAGFRILFGRLRDRIGALRSLYGGGALEIDWRAMGERAAAVRTARCELTRCEAERRSSRTGQRHPLGGFIGEVEYEGELGEFLPYLRAGKWTGVGRQTVWGKGEIDVAV